MLENKENGFIEDETDLLEPAVETQEDIDTTDDFSMEDAKSILTDEDYSKLLELRQKIHFAGKKVSKATKKERRKMLSDDEYIIMDSETVPEFSEAAKLQEDLLELAASAKSGRVLSGIITGVRPVDSNSTIRQTMAEVRFGHGTCQVKIPDFVLFEYEYSEKLTPEVQERVARRAEKLLGAEINFIVKNLDEKNRIAIADRLKACEKTSWGNYVRVTRSGNPRVMPGDKIEATVITVDKNFIVVNAFGSDSKISRAECDWGYIEDCRRIFHINQKVVVKVLAVKPVDSKKFRNEVYHLVATSLSVKQATVNPLIKYWDRYKENGKYLAEVTGLSTDGVFVNIEGLVPCLVAFPSHGEMPLVGQQKIIQITQKTEDPKHGKRFFAIMAST